MKKLLITGAKGMLAHDLIGAAKDTYDLILSDLEEMDITDRDNVQNFFEENKPDILINCAAYTAVDRAEGEGSKLNYEVNVLGQGNLAKICALKNIPWITISTDYVFAGDKKEGYLPDDAPNPVNAYGMAKYIGEQVARQHNQDTIIVRTSWLYGGGVEYKNFVNTMLRLANEKESLTVVDDQFGLPTYTVDLADYLVHIIGRIDEYTGKTLHANNTGKAVSRCGFTQKIIALARKDIPVHACDSSAYPTLATRPKYSMMLSDDIGYILPEWEDGLRRYLDRLCA